MMEKIKRNFFYFFFGIFYIGDCLSDAAIDASNTQQCYNIGGHEVCYFLGSEHQAEWHVAYEICQIKDSTLPIIRNANEQIVFEEYLKFLQLKRSGITFVWTAGKKTNFNDWMWINGQPVSDNFRQSMLLGDFLETHVRILKDYSIGVLDPDTRLPFLCQFYGERCIISRRIKLTNSCVVISNIMESWFNARSDCLARGGDLAVLSDQDLQIFKNYSQQLLVSSVWIGLRNMSWFWQLDSEGKQTEEIKYKKWGRNVFGTLGEECVHMEVFNGIWIRTDCREKHSVICQIIGNTTGLTTATTGDANACNQSTEPQSGSIGVLTFVLSIAGVVLVCIAFSAIVGIIAARKASATKNPERNVCSSTNAVYSSDTCDIQLQPAYEDLNESRY